MTAQVNWRDVAACRDADPDLFFPVGMAGPALRQIDQAKRICQACPVRAQCLTWAIDHGISSGVWGGATEDERRALRRRAGANRAAARKAMQATGRADGNMAAVRRLLRRNQPGFAAALESAVALVERELKSPHAVRGHYAAEGS